MNYFVLFLFTLIMAFALSAIAQPSQPMIDALSRAQFGANGELVATSEDRKTIYDYAKTQLGSALAELKVVPPYQQMILLQAGIEQKTGQDYLDLVVAVAQGVAERRLPKELAGMVLSPASSSKEGFIPVNFRDEELAAALRQLVPLYAGEPERVAFIEKVLSGKAKEEYLKWSSLQGINPIQSVEDVSATSQKQSSSINKSGPLVASSKSKSADLKPTSTLGEKPPLSTSWSVVAVLIVAAIGFFWLLLKKQN